MTFGLHSPYNAYSSDGLATRPLRRQRGPLNITTHNEKYYSKNSYLGPEEMPVNKNPFGSTVFHANFIASVADTARIFYLK